MNGRNRAACLPITLLAALVLAHPATAAPPTGETEDWSAANRLLFGSDHLSNLQVPTTLVYDYSQTGDAAETFSDTIRLDVTQDAGKDDKRVDIVYFSGKRRRHVPSVTDAQGNPILMVFLQREVNEMQRLTGGSWRYFQRAIKTALAEEAQVKQVQVHFRDQDVAATRVTITPYVRDPRRTSFSPYAGKSYAFTLCDAVPGRVFEITARVPQPAPDTGQPRGATVVQARLTFHDGQPATAETP